MSNIINLSNKNENVKEQKNETVRFFSVPFKAYSELKPKYQRLYEPLECLLANYTTFKYGLVGVHEKVTMKALALDSGIGRNNLHRDLKKLEEFGYVKIFNTDTVLIQILDLPSVAPLKDIYEVLGTVRANINDFNLFPKWENKFFEIYSKHYTEIDQGLMDTDPDDPFGYSAMTS